MTIYKIVAFLLNYPHFIRKVRKGFLQIAVTVVAVNDKLEVSGAHDLKVFGDKLLKEVKNEQYDVVVLPGGMGGLQTFQKSTEVGEMLKKHESNGKMIAAICAG